MKLICPFCNTPFEFSEPIGKDSVLSSGYCTGVLSDNSVPRPEEVLFSLGSYQILKEIGKGGMGEVFLAYDRTCGRRLALKRIRPDLIRHPQLSPRFLREARITSQLMHPAIVPIYTIQSVDGAVYYTMPFLEGSTLKEILVKAKEETLKGLQLDHTASIPALMRTFLTVCQAVAYAHAKGVIHRDLKPNNIIVGPYGEVLILDWGLAKLIACKEPEIADADAAQQQQEIPNDHTRFGKTVGTLAYMAPERALGKSATVQTDIYSLGVILYQILTLHHPFYRQNLKEFRRSIDKEEVRDPAEVAPYRDIPPILSRITVKCLEKPLEKRYKEVEEIIHDVETYLEGRSEWFQTKELQVRNREDWEFQENVLLAEHMAITGLTEESGWVNLMVSKTSFLGNTKIEATVCLEEGSHGIGFLLKVPNTSKRSQLNYGYFLWIGSDAHPTTRWLREAVEVIYAPHVTLKRGESYHIRIENIDNSIYLYLNGVLQFSYISHLALQGTKVGLLVRDSHFLLEHFRVFVGSSNIHVNCLAIPDAFLAHRQYATALSEYRKIAYSFPGTAEGREAMFRAGLALIEEAHSSEEDLRLSKYEEALIEFGKLHTTPGAPLEYLGKTLVYKGLGEDEEEDKCFELALKRYVNHPLLLILQEQLIYRMHESSHYQRKATYRFILLVVTYLPKEAHTHSSQRLFSILKKHWEPLYFIEKEQRLPDALFAIQLAFWLAKPHALVEIIQNLSSLEKVYFTLICNALFALIEMGAKSYASEQLELLLQPFPKMPPETHQKLRDLALIASYPEQQLERVIDEWIADLPAETSHSTLRIGLYFLSEALDAKRYEAAERLYQVLTEWTVSPDNRLLIDCGHIWTFLATKRWDEAYVLLQTYGVEQLNSELTPLYFLYGCWLCATKGVEQAWTHFSSVLPVAYPRSWSAFSHFMTCQPAEQAQWLQKAFSWEKRQLYRQLALFYTCAGDTAKAEEYEAMVRAEKRAF